MVEAGAGVEAWFDTHGLAVERARVHGVPAAHALDAAHPVLGRRLRVSLPEGLAAGDEVEVGIDYSTTAASTALQWLAPAQTADGHHPFLFSQCQAIHARSMVPVQDAPGVKFTYDARVTLPAGLTPLMSAIMEDGSGVDAGGDTATATTTSTFTFRQPVPLSPYLLALAAGRLEKADISPRIAIWAEPPVLARAAATFGEAEEFLAAVEAVTGATYRWGRADALVLPPSFPYGGMENPCMTFLTPTLLGPLTAPVDTGPASVVAHELAHSVFGNDITCATWADFWLNEGWCVWCERKVLARVRGPEAAALSALAGSKALADAVRRFGDGHDYTRLVTPLPPGADPDDAFSRIPYEKGCAFVCALEAAAGEAAFGDWVRGVWVPARRGGVASAATLQADYAAAFPAASSTIDWDTWLHAPGLPPGFGAGAPGEPAAGDPAAARARAAEAAAAAWAAAAAKGGPAPSEPADADVAAWPAEVAAHFLDALADGVARAGAPLPRALASALGDRGGLASATAPEVRAAFLCLAAPSGEPRAVAGAAAMATEQGRMKYSRPLFRALAAADKEHAVRVFEGVKERLHPICTKMVAGDLGVE